MPSTTSTPTPLVAFANPNRTGKGLELPEGTFFQLVGGQKQPPPAR